MKLTSAGEQFLPTARMITEELHSFIQTKSPWHPTAGGVTIAMPHSASISVLPLFKSRLYQTHSKVFFSHIIANQDTVARMLPRSEVDLAIVTAHPRVPIADELLVFKSAEIAKDRLVVVEPCDTAMDEKLPLHVSHPETYIGKVWQVCRTDMPITDEIPHGMAADIRVQCLHGNARGVLPKTLVEADLAAGRLSLFSNLPDLDYCVQLMAAPRTSSKARQVWEAALKWQG
jgi:DNA-binding transcriptional LysR family regulator